MSDAGDRVLSGFLSEVREEGKRPGGVCWYVNLSQRLHPDDLAELNAAMADRSLAAERIAKKLGEHGIYVHAVSLQRHRRGGCLCPR